jgi:Family of unknown function (DUF6353)
MQLVPGVVSQRLARTTLLAQKSSPEILLAAGIVGMVGSTVLACRATLKMDTVLDDTKEKLTTAKTLEHPDYSERDRQRDVSLIYYQTGIKIVRLYTPAIVLGGLSIYALTTSHSIMTKRTVALTAAYGALEKGFNEYRDRVIEKYGEEEDRNLRYGSQQIEIVDPKSGKKKSVTRVGKDEPSIYARFFDVSSSSWNREPEYNMMFLQCQQNYANDKLHARGHVFLNEVYDMLGLERSKAGAVVGWILSKNGETDNYIDFGVFNGKTQAARDFVNGFEGSILLDFNVDGVIYDKIDN